MPMPLREELDALIRISCPSKFKREFDRIQREYNHTVTIPEADNVPFDTYNCYAFALKLADHELYKRLVKQHSTPSENASALANSAFVETLLSQNELQEIDSTQKPEAGDIVLYFAQGKIQHAAIIVADDRLQSKWGTCELYQHALWEVPASYGDQVRHFKAPATDHISGLLQRSVKPS